MHGTLLSVMWQPGWEGRLNTSICVAESLHFSPETITTSLTGYTPIQNKKLKKNNSVTFLFGHKVCQIENYFLIFQVCQTFCNEC